MFKFLFIVNLIMKENQSPIILSAEELEKERLKKDLATTYTERFYALTKLIRISKMISNAKIIRNPKMS